jgi:hypothetical protein
MSPSSSICLNGIRALGDLGLVNTFTSLSLLTDELRVANALSRDEIMVDSKEVSVVFTLLLLLLLVMLRGVELDRNVVCDSACLFAVLNMLLLTGFGMLEARDIDRTSALDSDSDFNLPIS